jgi:hypothetical protein
MKDKYVEHRFPKYFVFGNHADGQVDIETVDDELVATVTASAAQRLVAERNGLVRALCKMAQAFDEAAPEKFERHWYESSVGGDVMEWIACSKRMPEIGRPVITINKFGTCAVLQLVEWHGLCWRYMGDENHWGLDSATHWMPLPEPPHL